MPKILFNGKELSCELGDNLRGALKKQGLSPHNGQAAWLNCKGLGSCGTCAVEIEGKVSDKTAMEKWRLQFPPHQKESGLRLACQCNVMGDLSVQKHEGFWGEKKI